MPSQIENLAVLAFFVYHHRKRPKVKPVLFLIPLLVCAVFLLIRAEIFKRRMNIYFLKPFATLVVIAMVLASFLEPAQNLLYTFGVLVGLVFSLGGDIALMFQEKRKAFLAGIGFFIMAQVSYSVVFSMLGRFTSWDILTALILIAAGVGFFGMIRRGLGSLKYPVIAYIVIISFMVSRAFSTFMSTAFHLRQALMIVSGALLFYFSDIILAANMFWRPWRYHRVNLVFYYSGQCLIALAASYFT
jgi:uncharacterized membrane protein YhhN